MQPRLTFITVVFLCLSSGLIGQQVIVTAREDVVPEQLGPTMRIGPLVRDSTLLMLSPDLVWRCEQDIFWGGGTLFEVDLERVRECEGRRELYELVRVYGDHYDYRPISRTLRARLTRSSETTFLYTEMDPSDTTRVVRSVPLVFDVQNVAYVDSSYTEDIRTGKFRLTITKLVELKVAP